MVNSGVEFGSVDWVLNHLTEDKHSSVLKAALMELPAADVANLLESMPPEQRHDLWELIPPEHEGEILTWLHDEARASIINDMDEKELVAAADSMEVSDLAFVLEELPRDQTDLILESLDMDRRLRLEKVLSYEDGTVGRLMTTDVMAVRPDVTVAVVLRWLRRHETLPPHTDALMVTSSEGGFMGKVAMNTLLLSSPERMISEVMSGDTEVVMAQASEQEVTALFNRRDLISVAVVDEQHHLIGRITLDDIVDAIRSDAEEKVMKSAGLDQEEDLFSPVIPSAKRRGVWLGINLITVFAAAWVIGQFEEALGQIVALAVLMPVVASMGGIAGSQTLTLAIRGLALNQIASSNTRWLLMKELAVGVLNGTVWAAVVAVVAWFWFNDIGLSAVIAAALIFNLLAAAVSGILVPLTLKKLGIDPALSGAVILTTVTDIIGFLSFLGLATLFLL
ncbi:magnesium transporter [Oceanospirillum sediminis]|uniref:Magnesium transporter MgtE n=1 Tax=Oceanospirillum sediminis TaxID=2760088 RepID=A0A839IQK5_9GAMM|nr:magnesium transporter [Oceanospirillum sediminis]MBB1487238.1 magnesium transporter [Oceanospirillum sediminis]